MNPFDYNQDWGGYPDTGGAADYAPSPAFAPDMPAFPPDMSNTPMDNAPYEPIQFPQMSPFPQMGRPHGLGAVMPWLGVLAGALHGGPSGAEFANSYTHGYQTGQDRKLQEARQNWNVEQQQQQAMLNYTNSVNQQRALAAYRKQMAGEQKTYHEATLKQGVNKGRQSAIMKTLQYYGVPPTQEVIDYIDGNGPYPADFMSKLKPMTGSPAYSSVGNVEGKILGIQATDFSNNPTPDNLSNKGLTISRMRGLPYTSSSGANDGVDFAPNSIFTGREDVHNVSGWNQRILNAKSQIETDPNYIAAKIAAPGITNTNTQSSTTFRNGPQTKATLALTGVNQMRPKEIMAAIARGRSATDQGWARINETTKHNRVAEGQGAQRIALSGGGKLSDKAPIMHGAPSAELPNLFVGIGMSPQIPFNDASRLFNRAKALGVVTQDTITHKWYLDTSASPDGAATFANEMDAANSKAEASPRVVTPNVNPARKAVRPPGIPNQGIPSDQFKKALVIAGTKGHALNDIKGSPFFGKMNGPQQTAIISAWNQVNKG